MPFTVESLPLAHFMLEFSILRKSRVRTLYPHKGLPRPQVDTPLNVDVPDRLPNKQRAMLPISIPGVCDGLRDPFDDLLLVFHVLQENMDHVNVP